MAWGRKAKRIAELEKELVHTRENLGIARVVRAPGFAQDVVVEKGVWYNVAYQFQHTGGTTLLLNDLVVTKVRDSRKSSPYFDGEIL